MAEQLGPGIWLLDLGFRAPLGSNAYLVDDGELTLVDAGMPVNARGIRREIDATGYAVEDIDRVLLTHYDLDHVGGLARLVPDLEAPVYVGEDDLALMEGRASPPLVHHKGLFHRGLRRLHSVPRSLDYRAVGDGDRIGNFQAFHTPGHNPGHTVYVNEALGVALLGDLVWEEEGTLTTPIWFDSYDMDVLRSSVREAARRIPAFDLAAVAHGYPILTEGHAALRALADQL